MKPLLLLHGALGSAHQMQGFRDVMSVDFNPFTLTFPGHGERAQEIVDFKMENFAGEVIRVLDELNLRSIPVFGYSMGGYVALCVARHHPDRFSRIMTLGTKFNWTPESAEAEVKMLNPDMLESKVPAFAAALKKMHGAQRWRNVLQQTAGMMKAMGARNPLTADDFRHITHPVLLGLGNQDKMVSREETQGVQKLMPGSRVCILEDTPHPFEKVDYNLLGRIVSSFLNT